MLMFLGCTYSSMPARPPSRPNPLDLTPPNGAVGVIGGEEVTPLHPAAGASAVRGAPGRAPPWGEAARTEPVLFGVAPPSASSLERVVLQPRPENPFLAI